MSKRARISLSACLSASFVLAFLSGCANYQWGDSAPLPFHTLYIKPATNNSFAPQVVAIVSSEIREAFIRDGRVKILASEEHADAVLSVQLTDYLRSAISRDSEDTMRARDFRISLQSKLSLYDQTTGNYFFRDRTVSANTSAYVGNPYDSESILSEDYRQAENLANPRLARDIGRQAANTVLGYW